MKIDGHQTEIDAMDLFKQRKPVDANKLQDKFLDELHDYISEGGDYCSCKAACKHHGHCIDCVSIHRGHRDHLPDCLKSMLNERMSMVLGLTESEIAGNK